ncbi:MAG: D-glycerate dehydrogenase [Balneolales bacterium]|nr:D-glycerate dehydrogenase [Balneolales bacterium]
MGNYSAQKPRVLLTEPIFPEVHKLLEQHTCLTIGERGTLNTENELLKQIAGYEGILSMLSNPFTAKVINAAQNLKVIANHAVGYNNIDTEACKKKNIRVANTPGVLTNATADGTLALMLSCLRNIPQADRFVRAAKFDGWHPTGFLGMELTGKNLGVLGLGQIGKAVATRCKAFGMQVFYHNRNRLSLNLEKELGVTYCASVEDLAKKADILTLHCPLTEETHHLIDKSVFSVMKNNAWLINATRGPVVKESDLAEALHSGKIAGAGLDVYEFEPHILDRLMSAPNTILLPHIASATRETRLKMGMLAAGAILKELCNTELEHNFVV